MFNQNLIVAVKANNKVLREVKDTAYLPFGCEYKILIKNMDARRVQVKVWIDGTDATEGTALVLNGHSEMELERFIKNANFNEGNRFKFIERTSNIENHRGSKVDDGFIRVEYQFEKPITISNSWSTQQISTMYPPLDTWLSSPTFGAPYTTTSTGNWSGMDVNGSLNASGGIATNSARSMNASASIYQAQTATAQSSESEVTVKSATANEVGITVPGSKSEQKFQTAAYFAVEALKHIIVLKLLGESPEGKKVEAPVTVKAKPVCTTCGRQNKATSKFCSECGTSLTLF